MTDRDLRIGELDIGSRPALIVVDLSLGFSSPESPLGGDFSQVIKANVKLVERFRRRNWPIFFSTVVYHDEKKASVFRQRLPDLNILQAHSKWVEIHPDMGLTSTDTLIEKQWPSAFFDTPLNQMLQQAHVDSLVITGLTTSGCVRATAVDGLQHNYPVFLPREACGDRNNSAHHASLHDIHAKYGTVMSLDELLQQLKA